MTAQQRTVSLFTGRTDAEDVRARDGSAPESRERPVLPVRAPLQWKPLAGLQLSTWIASSGAFVIECRRGKYVLRQAGEEIGQFDRILDASAAAERAR